MLSKRAQNLQPSPTLALASKAKEMTAEGHDVISLSVGEPDWDTFDSVKSAAFDAIKAGFTKYTPSSGIPALRKAIAEKTNDWYSTNYDPSAVTVSTGAKFIVFSALQCLIDPGDEVIIPAPYWVSYPTMVELAEGVPVTVPCGPESNFKLTGNLLSEAITDKTKVVLLNSPCNPTGEIFEDKDLKQILSVLKDHPDIIILSDDIYNRLVFNESGVAPHLLNIDETLVDRMILVNGVSKSYSMTGWRVGWALGPSDVIGAMNRYQSQSVSCACSFSQVAAVQALEKGEKDLRKSLKVLRKRRDFVFEKLSSIDGIHVTPPEGAFYIWPNVSQFFGQTFNGEQVNNSRDFAQALLESQKVVAVPGIEFGLEGHLRISYALNETRMTEAINRIQTFISELKSQG